MSAVRVGYLRRAACVRSSNYEQHDLALALTTVRYHPSCKDQAVNDPLDAHRCRKKRQKIKMREKSWEFKEDEIENVEHFNR